MTHRASVEDQDFRHAFEACKVAPAEFDHRAHLRLAYVYLCAGFVERACESMTAALLAFLQHLGVDESKYHATLTRAWILAVRHFMSRTPDCASAREFIDSNPQLLDTKIMLTHYSAEVLFSPYARAAFVAPDLQRIPEPRA